MSKVTLETVQSEISDVQALLEVVCETVGGMDFGHVETRNHDLDRVNVLVEIAHRLTGVTIEKIEQCCSQRGGRS